MNKIDGVMKSGGQQTLINKIKRLDKITGEVVQTLGAFESGEGAIDINDNPVLALI